MLSIRLGVIPTNLCRTNRYTGLLVQRGLKDGPTVRTTQSLNSLKKSKYEEDDQPLPYLNSEAAKWKARYAREPPRYMVWYTPQVVSISIAVFMIYFCILREENDIDEMIYRPINIEGAESYFPDVDINRKPEFIEYHEKRKLLKEQAKAKKEST